VPATKEPYHPPHDAKIGDDPKIIYPIWREKPDSIYQGADVSRLGSS